MLNGWLFVIQLVNEMNIYYAAMWVSFKGRIFKIYITPRDGARVRIRTISRSRNAFLWKMLEEWSRSIFSADIAEMDALSLTCWLFLMEVAKISVYECLWSHWWPQALFGLIWSKLWILWTLLIKGNWTLLDRILQRFKCIVCLNFISVCYFSKVWTFPTSHRCWDEESVVWERIISCFFAVESCNGRFFLSERTKDGWTLNVR